MITEFVDWLPGTMGHTPRWGQPWRAEDFYKRSQEYAGMAHRRNRAARFERLYGSRRSEMLMLHASVVCDVLQTLAVRYALRAESSDFGGAL